jgi:hypothetical protein
MSNNEISQEAKTALAEVSKRKARERLHRDGSDSTPAMQRRIQALAAERSIPPADFAKLLHKRVGMNAVAAFCEKHKVSMDWLLCGDLKGLLRTMQGCPSRTQQPVLTSDELRRAHEGLGEKDRAFISQYLTLLAKKGDEPTPAA